MGVGGSYLAPSFVIPCSYFQYNYEFSASAFGDVTINRKHGEADPICVSLSVGTYFTVIVRHLTLFYHTPEISYTLI